MEETKSRKLRKLSIEGFKSIRELKDFELGNLNILIGANGSGKSNFLEVFQLLREMVRKRLQGYIKKNGGADSFLFNGPKNTSAVKVHFSFGANDYRFTLKPDIEERFLISKEEQKYELSAHWDSISTNVDESRLFDNKDEPGVRGPVNISFHVYGTISGWIKYHFHDTSNEAKVRRSEIIEHNEQLTPDASNIASVLMRMKKEAPFNYREIVQTIRLAAPFFDDFNLKANSFGPEQKIRLAWKQKGSDYPMQPYHFSDGTLRFICLVTALLQDKPPSMIVIDEPELGLHPEAIFVISDVMKSVSEKTQIIASTQSPAFIDYFKPEDIVTVNRERGASVFRRLKTEDLNVWLEDYTLGELWRKNVVEGGTSYEDS